MRLVTRSDFDGISCAVLLEELGIVTETKFVHPKDVQDGLVEVTEDDVLCNLPYVQGCGLWFDHHSSEEERGALQNGYKGEVRYAPSCARVVFDYYGGASKFGNKFDSLMWAVDKSDSADLTREEVLNPQGWIMLSYLMDPRTGLGRFRDYRISNYQLMEKMVELIRAAKTADEILADPDVQERVKRYFEQEKDFEAMLSKYTRTAGNVIVTDLRGVETIHTGNRFMIYALYPEQNISIWVIDGRGKQNCVISVGHSIINRTSKTNVGSLMLKHGGGGHKAVGTCQVPYADGDSVIDSLINQMNQDG